MQVEPSVNGVEVAMESVPSVSRLKDSKSGQKLLAQEISPEAGPMVHKYCSLAQKCSAEDASHFIKEVLEVPGFYVFGELLYVPNIHQLSTHPNVSSHHRLLEIFAYGTYQDYLQNAATLPPLSPAMLKKLRLLTIVSMALADKSIKLDILQTKLALESRRELEDLIIDAIYADILRGKLDQARSLFEVDYALGRDVKIEDLPTITSTLETWCDSCSSMLSTVESVVQKANQTKEIYNKDQISLDEKMTKIKADVKKYIPSFSNDDEFDEPREFEKRPKNKKTSTSQGTSQPGSSKGNWRLWPKNL